jgi:uncharacterized protein (DUF58 family)
MKSGYRQYLAEGEAAGTAYTLQIPREAMRGAAGVQLGHLAGSSIDFKDYREYQPGDDLRFIDWNVFGRSDRLIVKQYREEVSPHLDLVLDGSRSMDLPGTAKAQALLYLAGVFGGAAANARCSHRAWLVGDGLLPVANGTERPSAWDGVSLEHARTPNEAYELMPPAWKRQGIRVLISDLLWEADPLLTLRPLAEHAAAVVVVQLLAEADITPGLRGNMRLIDRETGLPLEVFVDALAEKRYADALARHQQNWRLACRRFGVGMAVLVAEHVLRDRTLDSLQEAGILGVA